MVYGRQIRDNRPEFILGFNIHPPPWYKKSTINQGAFTMPPAAIQILKAVVSAVAATLVAILAAKTTGPPNDNNNSDPH